MNSPPARRRIEPERLLVELVNNHLDAGYVEAARRRGTDAPRRWYDRPAVIGGCLLIGFVLVVAYVHTHRGAPAAAKVHDNLVERVRAAQQAGDNLANKANGLERQLSAALPTTGPLAENLDLERLQAGLVAVSGPGITVTLSEPPQPTATPTAGRGGSTPVGATNILTDRDVRSVVNELWRDGAEAIAVNDVRLTPTSAIRFAGDAVLVDFQPITPPYVMSALGAADTLSTNFAESGVASRYLTLRSAEHIGFTFTDSEHLTLPASASVRVRYAKVGSR